jgi:lipoprotein signal peptidase
LDQGAKFISLSFGFYIEKNQALALGFLSPVLAYLILPFLFLSFALFSQKSNFDYFSFGLFLGGGVANLIDRTRFGYILDNLPFFSFFWFNLADLFIFLSICILAQKFFLKKRV